MARHIAATPPPAPSHHQAHNRRRSAPPPKSEKPSPRRASSPPPPPPPPPAKTVKPKSPPAKPRHSSGHPPATGPPPSSDTITWRPRRFGPPPPPAHDTIVWQPRPPSPPSSLGWSSSTIAPPPASLSPSAAAAAAFATPPGLLVAGIVMFLLAIVAIVTSIWILCKRRRDKVADSILVEYVGSSHFPGDGSSSKRDCIIPLSEIEDARLRDKLGAFVREKQQEHLQPSQLNASPPRRLPPSAFFGGVRPVDPIVGAPVQHHLMEVPTYEDEIRGSTVEYPPIFHGFAPTQHVHELADEPPRTSVCRRDPSAARRSDYIEQRYQRDQAKVVDPVCRPDTVFDPGDDWVARLGAAIEKREEMEKQIQRIIEFGMKKPRVKHVHRSREVYKHVAATANSGTSLCVHDSDAQPSTSEANLELGT
ncbi:BTB/POZ domain-containing protein 7 [Selaginella moellendorffii]|uniref:BTB/POZ domain-containing protein 7 n=1 Tax=Selaginella moellendorffii TaxID=88036 RepID=UPI000D1CDD11|nr:BTB/POZ domain-containing protein 7 [Selaginella moellendorffii]|eukprot:XP_024528748.1 BTB/POZ domain-containing protein 7 [Selaginella moellendorffii]